MGMSKDINNLVKEFMGVINVLQKGYYKYGLNNKLSNTKQKISNKNKKANETFINCWNKITTWISTEMKK